jgi:RloB-like protein
MVSKGRKVARELQRRRPLLDPRPRILVVCEGSATEPDYFAEFSQDLRAVISLVVDDEGGTPKTLVERAVAEKQKAERLARRSGDLSSRFSEIWCVFDIDQHPLVPDARQQAQAHGINLAVSNPCFELWLLLHFRDQNAFISRQSAQSACRHHMPGYQKHPDLELLRPGYDAAVLRATQLSSRNMRDGEPEKNPSTEVHLLTERLSHFGRAALIKQIQGPR